ncbi:hypothetical protein M407DRAFT_243215 [Tulasnella calospora MUT 4182]|uniref:Uncharacterized protein n=1 Tax=Tulasnella calospora MUT 4182 TaxID=1051891 RepID=A0A0C3M2M5_9AGAM|nr:hypothetical protein M407DRAFT_243215 [Tulasnella calospora MUT 4182]
MREEQVGPGRIGLVCPFQGLRPPARFRWPVRVQSTTWPGMVNSSRVRALDHFLERSGLNAS